MMQERVWGNQTFQPGGGRAGWAKKTPHLISTYARGPGFFIFFKVKLFLRRGGLYDIGTVIRLRPGIEIEAGRWEA